MVALCQYQSDHLYHFWHDWSQSMTREAASCRLHHHCASWSGWNWSSFLGCLHWTISMAQLLDLFLLEKQTHQKLVEVQNLQINKILIQQIKMLKSVKIYQIQENSFWWMTVGRLLTTFLFWVVTFATCWQNIDIDDGSC